MIEPRFIGRTGIRVSPLAFGTMSFGGEADEQASRALFARCRDVGINVFDTADVYQEGRSEEILGRLIVDCRDDVVLCSKSYFPTGRGANDRGSSRYHIVRAVDASLRRLKTDRLDVHYLHRFDDHTDLEDSLRGLELLVQQGKILYSGLSNFAAWQAMKAVGMCRSHAWAAPVCIQPMYNLLKRQAEVELLPFAASEGLGVFPYSPLAGGLLSGKFRGGSRPAQTRVVDNPMYATRYGSQAYWDSADALARVADELGVHPVALAVAWVAHHPAVTAPLLGARNVAQLDPALGALAIDMTPELRARLSTLSQTPPPATDRNEEATAHNYGKR